MKLTLTIIGALVALAAGALLFFSPKDLEPKTASEWCFYAEFPSLDEYEQTRPVQHAMIKFENGKVIVHAKCAKMIEGDIYSKVGGPLKGGKREKTPR